MFTRYHYTIIALCLVIAVDGMSMGLIWPMFGQLFINKSSVFLAADTSIHLRNIFYGLTLAIFNVGLLFGAPLLGDISDCIGRRKVLLVCLYGTSLSLGICALGVMIKSILLLFFGRVVLGVLAGSQALAQAAIVDISSKQHKMVNLSLLALANEVGFIIGPLLGGLLIDNKLVSFFNLTTPFIAAVLIALANGVFLMVVFKETFTPKNNQLTLKLSKGWNVFVEAFVRKKVRLLAIIYLCLNFGFALYFQFVVIYLIRFYHYTGAQVGYFISTMTVIAALSFLWLVRLAQRYFSLQHMASYFLLITALSVGFTFCSSTWVAWICLLPLGISSVIAYMAILTLFSEVVARDEQGWVMGVSSAICAVGWGGSAMVIGLIGAFSTPVTFLFAGTILLLGAVLGMRERFLFPTVDVHGVSRSES